ncbi:hypothetical protein NB688_000569 [Xanthomonas sacchari]|uniref:Uncharacterized protein n=1 Tax=Xanthomonas sacchari TaxID=56458 RepID=A0ABT3DUR7_9XANT|nr:hypothetical protein [Xanthomonas sacchari]MCW0398755.1 hypothetical protein [Xanthomonas sacchari]MCW0418403.1 hypothetical protein [Xanthomonas sacchari]UYK72534.1 hypothetical protein NG828_20495 [Xanthomonas sacchari]
MSIASTHVRDVRDDVRADVRAQTYIAVGVCGMCGESPCAGVRARARNAANAQHLCQILARDFPHIPHIPHIPTAAKLSVTLKPARRPAQAAHGRARAISLISLVSKGMEVEELWA